MAVDYFETEDELERADIEALVKGWQAANAHENNKWVWDHAVCTDRAHRAYVVTFRNFDHSEELTVQLDLSRGSTYVSHRSASAL